MIVKLRILFTLLAVACAAAIFPIGMFLGLEAAILCLMVGALFAGLMYICKQKQESDEAKTKQQAENPADPLSTKTDEKTDENSENQD